MYFDNTGHPAISVPAGTADGLPVGVMFVGDSFDDATVLESAHEFEQHVAPEICVSVVAALLSLSLSTLTIPLPHPTP